jgi:hypothetical protein
MMFKLLQRLYLITYLAHPTMNCSVNSKGLSQSITNSGFVQMIWIIVLEEFEKKM